MRAAGAEIVEPDDSDDDLVLPSGWVETTLEEIGVWSGGGTPSKRDDTLWTGGTIPWVSPKDMKSFAISDSQDRITHQAVEKSAAKLIPAGAVLFVTRSGILQHTFPVGVTTVEVTVNQDLKAIIPSGGIDSKYVAYFLISNNNKILHDCSKDGTTVQSIDTDALKVFGFPLASLAEQKRIVSKIDELFSDIEAGERALKRARATLARYRKSVLKSAVTGELTADWRAANRERLEPADKLLARILAARREAWEKAERAKLNAKGKAPKGEEWKRKYKEAASLDRPPDVALPEGWKWCSFDQIIISFLNGLSKKPAEEAPGDRILRISAVRSMAVNSNDVRFYRAENSESIDGYFLEGDDLLFTRYNGSARLVGVCGRFKGKEKTLYPDKIMRARLTSPTFTLPAYVELAMNSGASAAHIGSKVKTSAGQHGIAGSDVKRVPVPLPPTAEQPEIVSRVEEAFSKADHVEAALDEQERAARALKQSILKAAFEGRLIPQDPADEPAAKLLERIRKEKGK